MNQAVPASASDMLIQQHRVKIAKIVSSRYPDHQRPASWDDRKSGVDVVLCDNGEALRLWSDGQQSPPAVNSVIMILKSEDTGPLTWTLYGLPPPPEKVVGN